MASKTKTYTDKFHRTQNTGHRCFLMLLSNQPPHFREEAKITSGHQEQRANRKNRNKSEKLLVLGENENGHEKEWLVNRR